MTSALLLLCAGRRDLRELAAAGIDSEYRILRHDYATSALENLVTGNDGNGGAIRDPRAEIDDVVETFRACNLAGVITTDDYPGSTVASVVARRLGLPGVDPLADLLCQHKYYSRCVQASAAPEAVPWFMRIDEDGADGTLAAVEFPAFVKPVKSFFSIGARKVDSPEALRRAIEGNPATAEFLAPFDRLLREHASLAAGAPLIVEDYLPGVQCTLDGYAQQGRIHVLGIVDSILFPGTLSFERFEYPSSLEASVQERMARIAMRVMTAFGFDDGMFNIEFMYDAAADAIAIIEINPRMSSQFADLYEKVDGFHPYRVMVDIATGRAPRLVRRRGRHACAASCVLRTFADRHVLGVPGPGDVDGLLRRYPDVRVEILAEAGRLLSSAMQDGNSFRYGLINIGGQTREEILSIFEWCRQALPFALLPLASSENGGVQPATRHAAHTRAFRPRWSSSTPAGAEGQ